MKPIKKLRNQLFKILFSGHKCECLYCGKTYRKFMHEGVKAEVFKRYRVSGGGYKKNVKCPNCGSTDRNRLLYLFFKYRTDIYSKKVKLLHVSPNLQLADELRRHTNIEYVCGALNPDKFTALNAIMLDITDMAIDDNIFDIVVCNHVIEHVPVDADAMREIYRVLKPGGYAILQVPLALNLDNTIENPSDVTRKQRKRAYGQTDHLRLYGRDYFVRLKKAGFRVVRDNPFTNEWPLDITKYRLDPNEDVIICYKD